MANDTNRTVAEWTDLSRTEMVDVHGGFGMTSNPDSADPEAILIGLLLPAVQKVR